MQAKANANMGMIHTNVNFSGVIDDAGNLMSSRGSTVMGT